MIWQDWIQRLLRRAYELNPVYAAYLAQPSKMSFSQDRRRRGVAHADDIMYLNGHFLTQADKYPAEAAVAEILQQYWVNFAKTLNPNGKGLPYWPTFNDTKPIALPAATAG